MVKRLFVLLVLALMSLQASAEIAVKVVSRGDDNARYAIQMLELALQKSGTGYRLETEDGAWSSARLKQAVSEGEIDVMWAATDIDMEVVSLPVRVPLYKGLLGYRLLLVHPDNLSIFAGVNSLVDLRPFLFGQGAGWPDTKILLANGLKVQQATKYETLFYMVDGKRFDAFPRGANEPWGEIASHPDLKLAVEPHLVLVYKNPFYLFVNPARPGLARLIETGFEKALADGSFDEIFYNDAMVKMVIEKSNIPGRKAFHLENPALPKETPLDDARLWYDPQQAD